MTIRNELKSLRLLPLILILFITDIVKLLVCLIGYAVMFNSSITSESIIVIEILFLLLCIIISAYHSFKADTHRSAIFSITFGILTVSSLISIFVAQLMLL